MIGAKAVVSAPRFNPFDRQFRANPYPTYHALREHDPVHRSMGMWVLTRYVDVVAVLRDRRFLSGLIPNQIERQAERLKLTEGVEPFVRLAHQSIVFTDNPHHARLRRLVSQVFAPSHLAGFDRTIAGVVDELMRNISDRCEFDAIGDFAEQIPLRVMCRKLGFDPALCPLIGRWTHEIRFLLEPGLLKRSDFALVNATLAEYADFLKREIAARRRRPGDDLISDLMAARAGDETLSEEELMHACIMVFVAGNETTKGLIGNGIAALLDHPDQASRLCDDPRLVDNAVLEMLRWDSPLQQTKRLASEPVSMGGVGIKKDDIVLLCLGAANRDPGQFPDPDRFDIGRDTTGQLGFGFGMHACLGGRVAEREAAAAIGRLMARGPIRAGSAPRAMQESELIVRGYARLPVALC